MTKSAAQAMTLEDTPLRISKGLGRRTAIKSLEQIGTPTILWFLVKRHKTGLLITWGATVTILYLFPFVPALVLSLFKSV